VKNSYHISVTALDIKRGQRDHERFCPIARAINRKFHLKNGSKDSAFVTANVNMRRTTYSMSPLALGFINRFDAGQPVYPFEFMMNRAR